MKNYLIYVVEDNKVYNQLVTGFLKKKGYNNVKSFQSGGELIKSLNKTELPDIVIQDYFMQDLNGIEVLKRIKKMSPRTEFIFLTGNEDVNVAINSIKYGAFDYIIKDDVALDKVNDKIDKIIKLKALESKNKKIKNYMVVSTIILLSIIIISIFFSVVKGIWVL